MKNLWNSLKIGGATIGRLFRFLWQNKLWWLIPMIGVLLILFIILIFAQSSPLGPFIYVLF